MAPHSLLHITFHHLGHQHNSLQVVHQQGPYVTSLASDSPEIDPLYQRGHFFSPPHGYQYNHAPIYPSLGPNVAISAHERTPERDGLDALSEDEENEGSLPVAPFSGSNYRSPHEGQISRSSAQRQPHFSELSRQYDETSSFSSRSSSGSARSSRRTHAHSDRGSSYGGPHYTTGNGGDGSAGGRGGDGGDIDCRNGWDNSREETNFNGATVVHNYYFGRGQ
ncbi:hypothetical protein SISSUDRAFT_1117384 [Sistotremastrum suecicum HHB10207 ss-3]|uniref:Uncharacterized protein n=1 Tax=Sistotremastrum suecicum HHB10207 ss-3 TaxID=1314776 RepID=A0A166GKW2_9AGAM|nr:hypothetical protein SISSUDRAFT_1117384 [Sistotremastrum suecicum HHB10207 ss-3]